MQRTFFLTMAIFQSWAMTRKSLHLCNWCFPLHAPQLSWISTTYEVTADFLALSCFRSSSCETFSDAWARKSIKSTKSVYDGTSLWFLLWFCHVNIQDQSNFNSMTDDMNDSNELYFIVWSALMCCFTMSCKWRSSWPPPRLNEGALTIARTWAWWINYGLSYQSRRQPIVSK